LSEFLREVLGEEEANTVAAEVLTEVLTLPGVLDAVLASIPDDWRYSDYSVKDGLTKWDFAYMFLWEYIQSVPADSEDEEGAS